MLSFYELWGRFALFMEFMFVPPAIFGRAPKDTCIRPLLKCPIKFQLIVLFCSVMINIADEHFITHEDCIETLD